jgi:aspartate kinase
MIVIKFGGTSVGDPVHLRRAIEIVANAKDRGPVVVVSALGGVTNQLVEATALASRGDNEGVRRIVESIRKRHEESAFQLVGQKTDYLESFLAQVARHTRDIEDILKGISLVGDVSLRAKDKIVAIGEKLSSVLFSYAMRLKMLTGVHVDAEQVIVTDENFGEAAPQMAETRDAARKALLPEIERAHIPVMGGFIGRSRKGGTTTLGRGGSDYSAAIVGAVLGAEEIQIWTDVDGMMTCDPRLIPDARMIDLISYDEAAELAYFGAKVLHPKTITPAVEQQIPIRVLNTHNPESPGTLITREGDTRRSGPRAIAMKKGITLVHITSNQMLGAHGFLARIFNVFDRLAIPVDLITTSEVSVSLTIDRGDGLDELTAQLSPFADVKIERDQAIIAVVGRAITRESQVLERLFGSLRGLAFAMVSLGSSDLNLSIVLPASAVDDAVRRIHLSLFERAGAAA